MLTLMVLLLAVTAAFVFVSRMGSIDAMGPATEELDEAAPAAARAD